MFSVRRSSYVSKSTGKQSNYSIENNVFLQPDFEGEIEYFETWGNFETFGIWGNRSAGSGGMGQRLY